MPKKYMNVENALPESMANNQIAGLNAAIVMNIENADFSSFEFGQPVSGSVRLSSRCRPLLHGCQPKARVAPLRLLCASVNVCAATKN